MRGRGRRATGVLLAIVAGGCTGQTRILPNPSDARVLVDGEPVPGNVLEYGRWVGNDYRIVVSAPNFVTQEVHADVELRDRAGGLALAFLATVVGIPLLPAVLWNGEIDDRIYVSLAPLPDATPTGR